MRVGTTKDGESVKPSTFVTEITHAGWREIHLVEWLDYTERSAENARGTGFCLRARSFLSPPLLEARAPVCRYFAECRQTAPSQLTQHVFPRQGESRPACKPIT